MDYAEDIEKIKDLSKKRKDIVVSYGGDGTILDTWRDAVSKHKIIFPVRNYGRCERHRDPFSMVDFGRVKAYHPVLCKRPAGAVEYRCKALSEIQVKSADITSALRRDVYVDGRKFFGNVIADGVLCSSVFGATGYFSSVAHTLFDSGLGLAFVAPTVGVSNLVLRKHQEIRVKLLRAAEIQLAADKIVERFKAEEGQEFAFSTDVSESALFVGFDEFHCPECRAKRHGTSLVAQYIK